ncbi:hypothetical protein BP5796_04685 [Coleophoma crateriformis]|uniref:WD40 repeat-like protein n=1 Tax=Coleophoma crateriformis TaxID=565419 RepID=A0A3D8SAQ9_9HELO|nr:hypothetical protein BP5796_04685 [Coleophoma crateriformis]
MLTDENYRPYVPHGLIDLTGTDSEDDAAPLAEQRLSVLDEAFPIVALPRVDTDIVASHATPSHQSLNSTELLPVSVRRTYREISSVRSDHAESIELSNKRRRVSAGKIAQADPGGSAVKLRTDAVLYQGHSTQGSVSRHLSQSSKMRARRSSLSQVSSRKHAHNPRHQSNKMEDRLMASFLKDHLLPCVKEAVTVTLERVSSSESPRVARRLIENLDILPNLQKEGWHLSPTSAEILYTEACRLAGVYATASEDGESEADEVTMQPGSVRVCMSGGNSISRDIEDHVKVPLETSDTSDNDLNGLFDNKAPHDISPLVSGQFSSSARSLSSSASENMRGSSRHKGLNTDSIPISLAPRRCSRIRRNTSVLKHHSDNPFEEAQAPGSRATYHQITADAQAVDIACRIQNMRYASYNPTLPRPYIQTTTLGAIKLGLKIAQRQGRTFRELENRLLHVDFCSEEIKELLSLLSARRPKYGASITDLSMQLTTWMRDRKLGFADSFDLITSELRSSKARSLLGQRDHAAISAFLKDASTGVIGQRNVITMQPKTAKMKILRPSLNSLASLLRGREAGDYSRASRGLRSFKAAVHSTFEDTLIPQDEWTDSCGDIFTLSWTSATTFVCGATAHSDYHNMQYNKPGNLLVGSTSEKTLRSVPDHRIVRPEVTAEDNTENAMHSMRHTQDPWLYTSVVSSSYNSKTNYTFTASFDHTVKIWNVHEFGASMNLLGTWQHDAKVNFVLASEHHGLVATAVDIWNNAIRVYRPNHDDMSSSSYDTYSGERACAQAEEVQRKDSWAYFPATIQWGCMYKVAHLLLVGYSPRSLKGDDNDIPEDKRNTGELCLWNAFDKTKVLIPTARTQNIFEVLWHPTQPIFFAATTPCGIFEVDTKTQINIFAQNKSGAFLHIRALECHASDVNELTVMPNSNMHCYVTASCTDGNTYVWDTAQSDQAVHVLGHGKSLDNPLHDLPREVADIGVKFAAWGKTSDRFYTGSSDGRLKSWNVKAPRGEAFIQNVLTTSAGILVGKFSKDFSKLLVGDATGTVHLLGLSEKGDEEEGGLLSQKSRRPRLVIPHPEPGPPVSYGSSPISHAAQDVAHDYLVNGQIILHPDPTRGAVQGPLYHRGNNFRRECHIGQDPSQPLLPQWEALQQYHRTQDRMVEAFSYLPEMQKSDDGLHKRNNDLEFDFSGLDVSTQAELIKDRVELGVEEEPLVYESVRPRFSIFRGWRKRKGSDALC